MDLSELAPPSPPASLQPKTSFFSKMTQEFLTVQKRPAMVRFAQRFLMPAPIVSLYYFLKYGAKISPRAEVELTSNLSLGKGFVVGSFTKIKASDGTLAFGKRCGIATGCFISASSGGIEVGDNFICGPNVSIVGSNYITDELGVHLEDQGHTSKGIKIGSNVWIGSNTTILDGTVIGDDSIIVANSLLNRRYPDRSIIQGNPGKKIFQRG